MSAILTFIVRNFKLFIILVILGILGRFLFIEDNGISNLIFSVCSWLVIKLVWGVILGASLWLFFSISNNSFKYCCLIPVLIFLLWIANMDMLSMHNKSYTGNHNLRYWMLYWLITFMTTLLAIIYKRRKKKLGNLSSTEDIYKQHDKLNLRSYNPLDYYDFKNKKIFMALDGNKKPIYCDYESFIKKSHGNSTGRSQTGKNVAIQNLAVQLLNYDEFVVMCDAKDGGDDVMAPVLYKYANYYQKAYNYVELSLSALGQFNILQIKDADFLKKILLQLAKLEETGDQAVSYYIQQDNATAQKIALFIMEQSEEITIYDLVTNHFDLFFDLKKKEQTSLQTALIKLSYKKCINAKNGFKYEDLIKLGGCLYIQAKTKDENVILSVMISSLRFVRAKERILKTVTVIADEFMKYVSQDFIDIFTEGAGKGFKLITAYQTSALLEVRHIGLNARQMLSVIMSNNSYEYIYGTRDPLILEVFEEHYAGTKIIQEEVEDAEASLLNNARTTGQKKLKQILQARYPKELLTKLRTGEFFLYVNGKLLELCYNGYLPLMNGVFNKESCEFQDLVTASRRLTLIAPEIDIVDDTPVKDTNYENLFPSN